MKTKPPLKRYVPVSVIQTIVSKKMHIPVSVMIANNKTPGARKREIVTSRQISMTLSYQYCKGSLSVIGYFHGLRDHATVLHACKTINNMLDINDPLVVSIYTATVTDIENYKESLSEAIELKNKARILKKLIQNKVPIDVRNKVFSNIYCKNCGQIIYNKFEQ